MMSSSPRERPLPSWVRSELADLAAKELLREPLEVLERSPGAIHLPSGSLVDFTSNDYLGLSSHRACQEAACDALYRYGCGSGSSRIVTGHCALQASLESALSEWLECDASVLFPSGYQANVGVVTALAGPGDLIFSDAHNHASLVDGCRLSRATVRVYPHLDAAALEEALALSPEAGRRLVVTESVFSMDGEAAPLGRLEEACRRHGAILVVDEAHAIGLLGPQGRGLSAAQGVRPDLTMGTFSKALGSHGAFVAGAQAWIRLLWNRARALIYSTALPPPSLGASLAALALVGSSEGETLRQALLHRASLLRSLLEGAGIPVTGAGTSILAIGFEDPGRATRLQHWLKGKGLLTWAFRPPTVPPGTSTLRISVAAHHGEASLATLAEAVRSFLRDAPASDREALP